MLEKNKHYNIIIDDISSEGTGVGHIDGFAVFTEGLLIGEEAEIRIVKLKKNYGFGKVIKLLKPCPQRITPKCQCFQKCGGCSLQHMSYEAQLEYKRRKVAGNLQKIGGFSDLAVPNVIGMENPYNYRNKALFPVGLIDGEIAVGLFKKRSHTIVAVSDCYLQHLGCSQIIKALNMFFNKHISDLTVYDEESHSGLLRHTLIKQGFHSKEVMVCIVINGENLPFWEELTKILMDIEGMTSISININKKRGNTVLGGEVRLLWGKPYIMDSIGGMDFQISPLSFFQINPVQTEILYKKAVELAELKNTDIVLDLFCGVGTITLFMAKHAKHAYGVEIVEEAVSDANTNAALNGIENVTFTSGDSDGALVDFCQNYNLVPDVLVMDPPRKGCAQNILNQIEEVLPPKIVYVSCDSATLARDLKFLCQTHYKIEKIEVIDCFPMTTHVETCVLLSLNNS